MWLIVALLLTLIPGQNHPQAYPSQPRENSIGTDTAPTSWLKLDAGPFSILAPPGWEFHQLQGVDSYVGEFVGDGVTLTFDFGRSSSGYLKEAKQPVYGIAKRHIGGFAAKIVSPQTPGHGITAAYFRKVSGHDGLYLWGKDLSTMQKELVLQMFDTIRFGGPVPPYVIPPPPPPTRAAQ